MEMRNAKAKAGAIKPLATPYSKRGSSVGL
jgi:hypothetical protein